MDKIQTSIKRLILGISLILVLIPAVAYASDSFETEDNETGVTITQYLDYQLSNIPNVIIPEVINGKPVTKIGEEAFYGAVRTKSVTIPDSVTSIGPRAFWGCSSLSSVSFPANLKGIGERAFRGCSKLGYFITLPDGISSIDNQAFWGCSSLYSITIPKSVTYIGSGAFQDCPNLTIKCYKDSVADNYAKKNNINVRYIDQPTIVIHDQIYTGKAVTPEPVVSVNGENLTSDVDYKVSYKNNINAGVATTTIEGRGVYSWKETREFSIQPRSISDAEVPLLRNQFYTGEALCPEPGIIVVNGKILHKDVDYVLSYENNTNVGTATMIVAGKGNYSGEKGVQFNIVSSGSNDNQSSGSSESDSNDSFESGNQSDGVTNQYASNPKMKGDWKKSGNRWWYQYRDGSFPANSALSIDGKVYRFDGSGWMLTGWQKISNKWYYFKGSGAMTTGWQKVKSKWYFMNAEGVMQTGKITDKGKTYFLDGNGAMKTGWVQQGSSWYYTNKSGAMVTGWQKAKGVWYYLNPADGKMATGKQAISGKTYFLKSSGAMKTGWNQEGSKWYYYDKSGAMKTNAWISGKYWVGSNGVMATSSWVDNNKYYVDGAGKWMPNANRTSKAA